MNKTILRLDLEFSIMILSIISMLFSFLTSYVYITNFTSFLYVLIKSLVFVIVPLILYILERRSLEFKRIAGIYTSYFIISMIVTLITSISVFNGNVPLILKGIFDIVNLMILLTSLFILIEQILIYSDINFKVYSNTIMKIVYLVGSFISYPFLVFIDKKSKKNDKE